MCEDSIAAPTALLNHERIAFGRERGVFRCEGPKHPRIEIEMARVGKALPDLDTVVMDGRKALEVSIVGVLDAREQRENPLSLENTILGRLDLKRAVSVGTADRVATVEQ